MRMTWALFAINTICMILVIFVERKKSSEVLFWVATLYLLPVVGLVLYFVFGSTIGIKLNSLVRARKLSDIYNKAIYEQMEIAQHLYSHNISDAKTEAARGLAMLNLVYSGSMLTPFNRIEIITSGIRKYAKLYQDIEQATHSVHMEYYGFHADEVGETFLALLTKKAKEGVHVKLMYDFVGGFSIRKRHLRAFKEAGGLVVRMKPYVTHFRNHRKIVVIDGSIAYTGGMNIGIQYADKHKKKNPWRDTQIRIQGDSVYALQFCFLYDWMVNSRAGKSGLTPEYIMALFPQHQIEEELFAQVVFSGADSDREQIKMAFLKAVTGATQTIRLQTPYFIPDKIMMTAFQMAAASGVQVEIMLPQVAPSFFLKPVSDYYISQLLEFGVRVFLYDGYLHAKTFTIDSSVTMIGSANMDIRSLEVDDEICLFCYSEELAQKHISVFREDQLRCVEMDYDAFLSRGVWRKLKERFYSMFAVLM